VNSFSDEAGFLKVGADILDMLRTEGFDYVNRSLRGWLEEATQQGSGDDTTLAVVCRMDALAKPAPAEASPPPAEEKKPQGAPTEGRSDAAGGDKTPPAPAPSASPAAASSENSTAGKAAKE
jgi:hypothetical protein